MRRASPPRGATSRGHLDDDRYRFLVGDVRNESRLRYAMADVDIRIHAAAMKHVDVVEVTPVEAVKTNVLGTQHVIEAAIDAGGRQVLVTSSDTAVELTNTMGTTKLFTEKPACT